MDHVSILLEASLMTRHTVDEYSVGKRVHCPNVWSPIGVAESTRKWK